MEKDNLSQEFAQYRNKYVLNQDIQDLINYNQRLSIENKQLTCRINEAVILLRQGKANMKKIRNIGFRKGFVSGVATTIVLVCLVLLFVLP